MAAARQGRGVWLLCGRFKGFTLGPRVTHRKRGVVLEEGGGQGEPLFPKKRRKSCGEGGELALPDPGAAKDSLAGKEDAASQTSCFCCVPEGPELRLTERGQVHVGWGQSPGRGYGRTDSESFGAAVPNLARVRGERREPPRGRRCRAAASGPGDRPRAFAKQLPPSGPGSGHPQSLKAAIAAGKAAAGAAPWPASPAGTGRAARPVPWHLPGPAARPGTPRQQEKPASS